MRLVRSCLWKAWDWSSNRILILGAPRDEVGGIEVRTTENASDGFRDLWVEKLRRAVRLIDDVSPVVGRRLRKHVRLIVISDVTGPEYVSAIRAIRLLGPKMTRQDVEGVALTVVHEATHARIHDWGIPYVEGEQARHERACVRAEVRVALRLPDGRRRAEAALARLRNPWWTQEAMTERALRQLDRLDIPTPFADFLAARIRRRRNKR